MKKGGGHRRRPSPPMRRREPQGFGEPNVCAWAAYQSVAV